MQEQLKASPKYKLMEVDNNREKVYNACRENLLSIKEISQVTDINISRVKAYVTHLVKSKHLEKFRQKSPYSNQIMFAFKSTENVYKPRSVVELDEYFNQKRKVVKPPKKYLYDDLIASNPDLRKINLFDTKPTKDFLGGQKDKVNRGISSSWGMYDSF